MEDTTYSAYYIDPESKNKIYLRYFTSMFQIKTYLDNIPYRLLSNLVIEKDK